MYTNCFYNFKMALYVDAFSPVVMKSFNSSRNLFCGKIVTVKLKASLLLNVSLCICPLTFLNKALRLSGSPLVASTVLP